MTGTPSPERIAGQAFLRHALRAGPVLVDRIMAAGRDAGIRPRTLHRCARDLNAISARTGAGSQRVWSLQPEPPAEPDWSGALLADAEDSNAVLARADAVEIRLLAARRDLSLADGQLLGDAAGIIFALRLIIEETNEHADA